MRLSPFATIVLLLPSSALAASVEVSPGDDLGAAMNGLQPGDELVLHEGTYELEGRLGVTIVGTADAPIVVRAADGEVPHLHRAGADQNIIDIDDAQYVTFRGIEFSGGSAGLRISGATHLTIEDCHVHDTGDVAIRANDGGVMYDSMIIRRNHVHDTNDTGEGMYLGCNSGECAVFDSVIEGNWVHHTNGPTIVQGDGIELKQGSHDNVIRDNVIHDTYYPCITTYSTAGSGTNVIERNVLWHCGDHGIQATSDTTLRNNIVLEAAGNGISIQPHEQAGSPQNIVLVHNTVLHPAGDPVALRNNVGMIVIANNALYSQGGNALFGSGVDSAMVVLAGNVGQGAVSGIDGTIAPGDLAADFDAGNFAGAPPVGLFPSAGSALLGAGDPAHAVPDDFNCLDRPDGAPDAGAYLFDAAGNPGWTIQEGFKTCAAGGDGGSTDDGGSDDGGVDETNGEDVTGADSMTDDGLTGDGGPDSGATLDGGATSAADTSGDAGAGDEDGDDSGCSCTAGPRSGPWALVVLGLVVRRRIRTRARSTAARGG